MEFEKLVIRALKMLLYLKLYPHILNDSQKVKNGVSSLMIEMESFVLEDFKK